MITSILIIFILYLDTRFLFKVIRKKTLNIFNCMQLKVFLSDFLFSWNIINCESNEHTIMNTKNVTHSKGRSYTTIFHLCISVTFLIYMGVSFIDMKYVSASMPHSIF